MKSDEMKAKAAISQLNEETVAMASGTIWQNLGNMAIKLISFIYTILIARLASQDDVGAFYFGLGIIGVIGIFADLGLSTSLQRYVAYYIGKKDKSSADHIIRLSVILIPIFATICSFIVISLASNIARFFGNPALEPVLVLLSVYLIISQIVNICAAILTALKRMKESSLAYSLQNILKVLLTLALFFLLGASAKTLAIAFILSYMPIAFYLLFVSHNALKPISTNEPMQLSRYLPMLYELVPFGLTMVGVVLFSTIIGYTDRVMLGFYLQSQANAQIAIYTMAISFAGIGALFASSVLTILFPISSELVGKGELARLNQTAKTAMRWVLFSSVPIVAFIAAFSSPLLRLLYGAAYEPGAIAMSIYTIGVFAGLFGSVQRTTLAGMRLIKIELLSVIAGSIVNVGLNMIFIPLWGINGAAFASLMAFASMSAVNQYFAKRYCKFTIPNPAWKNLAAGIFIFILLSAISWLAYPYLTSFAIIGKGESLLMIIADKVAKLAILGIFFAISVLLYVIAINLMHLPEEEDTYIMHRILSKMQIPQKISNLIVSFAIWDSHHHLKNKG